MSTFQIIWDICSHFHHLDTCSGVEIYGLSGIYQSQTNEKKMSRKELKKENSE